MKSHVWIAHVGALLLCSIARSQSTQPSTAPSVSPEEIRIAAEKTFSSFNRAWQAGAETQRDPIPSKYWDELIRSLNPIRVYTHRANMVIVLREQDGVEEGKYVYLSISSYLPTSGVDGFMYMPNPRREDGTRIPGTGVLDYRREKVN